MSLQFSDTTNYRGLVQMYEREIGAQIGEVSSDAKRLKLFTADANLALDDYTALAIQVSGKWKMDDYNHSDYPEIYTDIVAGQRDYTFITDENGNIILDIYKVYYKDGDAYKLLDTYDADSEKQASTFSDGQSATGTPSKYDKTTNAIRLDVLPTANVTDGLKVSINREANYFTSTDTTKKVGFPGVHHAYFYKKPAREYARRNRLDSYQQLDGDVQMMERQIKEYFDRRAKDERMQLNINRESTR